MNTGSTSGVLRFGADSIPRPALVLGIFGLLPFMASAMTLQVGAEEFHDLAYKALVGYSVAILSFMGGIHWGLAMGSPDQSQWLRYGASVAPALLAWAALLSPPAVQLPALAAGFSLLLAFDLSTVRRGTTPAWYRQLRWPLTVIVVICLFAAWLSVAWN